MCGIRFGSEVLNPSVLLYALCNRGLIQMDWLSKSDPVVAVYEQGVGSDDWSYVGETEILK